MRLVSRLVAPAPISEPTCSYSGWSRTHWQFPDSRTPSPSATKEACSACAPGSPDSNTPGQINHEGQESTGKCSSFLRPGQLLEGSSTLSSSRTEPQLPTAQIHILTHLAQVFFLFFALIPHSLTRASLESFR